MESKNHSTELGVAISKFLDYCDNYRNLSSYTLRNYKSDLDDFLKYLSMMEHYESLSRGVIDSRDIIYFLSLTCIEKIDIKIKFKYIFFFILIIKKFSFE